MEMIGRWTLGVWGLVWVALAPVARADVSTFTDQATFEAALTGGFTLVNLDATPLSTFATPYNVEDSAPATAFEQLGVDFQAFDAAVIDGQAFQISLPGRDRLIINGVNSSTGGNLVVDLVEPVRGFGAWSNDFDGGRIRAFSGPGLGGSFLGEAAFGSGFGGLISTDAIRSVEITCDFDFDLICGVFDIQFGTTAASAPVPVPVLAGSILCIVLASLGVVVLRRGR